jgi:hypothetical protein
MKDFSLKIINDVLVISLVTLIAFFICELLKPGFVTNYLNMNLFLLWCVLIGIIQIAES